ncbi:MAG: hypothetical protein ABFD23_04010 [Caldisericales bacterium]|nr:hypothetical protein [bacterium]
MTWSVVPLGAGPPFQGNDTDFENPIILFGSNFANVILMHPNEEGG